MVLNAQNLGSGYPESSQEMDWAQLEPGFYFNILAMLDDFLKFQSGFGLARYTLKIFKYGKNIGRKILAQVVFNPLLRSQAVILLNPVPKFRVPQISSLLVDSR